MKTLYAIASSFNTNVPLGVGVASGKNLTPGICFGSSVVWCKRTLGLKPSEPSSADAVFAGSVEKCRRIQFAYEKWGAGEEKKNDEKRTVQALEAEGLTVALGPNGYQEMVNFDKSLETLANKLVGTQGRDGTFLIKLAGPVLPNGRGAHWMAFRRATNGDAVVRIEFFDVNRFCLQNSPNESLAAVATEIANYLKWAYNGGNGGGERFTDYCLLYAVSKTKVVKVGGF